MSKYSRPRSFDAGAFDANALSSATYPSSSGLRRELRFQRGDLGLQFTRAG